MKRKLIKALRFDYETLITLGYVSKNPQRQLLLGYFAYIVIGTLLLCLPFMTTNNSVSWVDHLFTATSAISTTGLATIDVSSVYSFLGQLTVLALIQIGGLGYMTLSSFVMYSLTKHFTIIKKGILEAEFALPGNININHLVKSIVIFTFSIEIIGAAFLYYFFVQAGAASPIWSAIFHSVSAFCTAGFSIYSDNLMQFDTNIGVNTVIILLCYLGAMGFIFIIDIWRKLTIKNYNVTFTTKIIIVMTLILSTWGTAQMFFLESNLQSYPPFERFIVSLFQTMSALSTAGYNTINIGNMLPITIITLTSIMYFGASPSGTGGGLKSTTSSAVFAFVKCKLSMKRDTYLFGNRLPSFRVDTAITTFALYTTILFFGAYFLTATEKGVLYIQLLFEAASALGTVGLTTGITTSLTVAGKFIIIVLMYIGRVGVLTIGTAMLLRMEDRTSKFKKSEDLAV